MQQALEKWLQGIKETRWLRNTVGILLLIGGIFGPLLPILGVWMVPLGLVLLAVDFPWAQRLHERLRRYWLRVKKRYARR